MPYKEIDKEDKEDKEDKDSYECPHCGEPVKYKCPTCRDTGGVTEIAEIGNTRSYSRQVCPDCRGACGPIVQWSIKEGE